MKVAVLDNLRSVHNVGSIFRTANAAGIEKIYLCGTTPTPLDKKGNKRSDFAKVALGAEETINWEYHEDSRFMIQELRKKDFYIISLEQDERSIDYKKVNIKNKENIAFVIGGEVEGIQKEIIELSDVVAEIPMLGTKESLNVTIAFGIGVYKILGI
ncbi:MAG: tRNA/rRNA methyltransferase SpoU [Candidatus Nomurabacteria bacterium]|nr:tRNA/rRNA methyltransferase SpoU [Candidatus Nomurabacteria bacterium]